MKNKFNSRDKFKILSHHYWGTQSHINESYLFGEVVNSDKNRAGPIYVSMGGVNPPQYVYESHCIPVTEEEFQNR
jgi:hypothetical protein